MTAEIAPIDLTPIIIAFITIVGGGTIAGLFAYRKSNKEAENQSAQAAANVVGAADDVVTMMRAQMAEQATKIDALEGRVETMEVTITAWDGWADSVMDIIYRSVGMLTDEQRAALLPDVEHARDTRPPRYHQFRAKNLIQRDEGT